MASRSASAPSGGASVKNEIDTGGQRSTTLESVELLGASRALVKCVVELGGRQLPSSVFSSPLSISFFRSLAPPMNVPLMKTSGNVGQPIHIFSASRRRQPLK